MDNLSNKRVRRNGMLGRIQNCVEVGVCWDNGGMTRESLAKLEFVEDEEEKEYREYMKTWASGYGEKPVNVVEKKRSKYGRV